MNLQQPHYINKVAQYLIDAQNNLDNRTTSLLQRPWYKLDHDGHHIHGSNFYHETHRDSVF